MSKVFVLDTLKRPLDPVHSGEARILLNQGKAAVFRRFPFTIILKEESKSEAKPLRIKIDPGSRTTGLAIVDDFSGEVVWAAELQHRGHLIKTRLDKRREARHKRRSRKTRYRQPRFLNRTRPKGWLPPSLMSRVANIVTWIERLSRFCCVTNISMELVKFDTQKMQNPEISGIEYQQGTLAGYEIREYLLEKWNRKCSYCGITNVQLQIEHIVSKKRMGSSRISNLCLACQPCNQEKGTQNIQEFLKTKPELLKKILSQAKAPLRDTAAVNNSRWKLWKQIQTFDVPVECGSGGLTKYNRTTRNLPKTHWIDAACVGASTPNLLKIKGVFPLTIRAMGHGRRQLCHMNKFGFPRSKPKGAYRRFGFRPGDIVQANVPIGKYAGNYVGRVLPRIDGYLSFTTVRGNYAVAKVVYCTKLQKSDGYSYSYQNQI